MKCCHAIDQIAINSETKKKLFQKALYFEKLWKMSDDSTLSSILNIHAKTCYK